MRKRRTIVNHYKPSTRECWSIQIFRKFSDKWWHCTKEIRLCIAMVKSDFTKKRSQLTRNLNFELKKKLINRSIWSIALYVSKTWTSGKIKKKKYPEIFEMWCWTTTHTTLVHQKHFIVKLWNIIHCKTS